MAKSFFSDSLPIRINKHQLTGILHTKNSPEQRRTGYLFITKK
jgi:hypothetical protein